MAAGSRVGLECQTEAFGPQWGVTGGWIREVTQRTGDPEAPVGSTLSKSHSSSGRVEILTYSCLPGPTLRGPQAYLVAMTQEWSLDDGEGGLAATSQGWARACDGRRGV